MSTCRNDSSPKGYIPLAIKIISIIKKGIVKDNTNIKLRFKNDLNRFFIIISKSIPGCRITYNIAIWHIHLNCLTVLLQCIRYDPYPEPEYLTLQGNLLQLLQGI